MSEKSRIKKIKIVILGASGLAREVYWHLSGIYEDFVFVDDVTPVESVSIGSRSFPVVKNWDFSSHQVEEFIIGVGSPQAKKVLVERALAAGLRPVPTFIHPRALVQDAKMGSGGIIAPGCVVTTNIAIGDYVVLNLNCTVGHDTVIGDFVTVNPGCHISGNTMIGRNVMLGTGTVVREKATIAEGVVTGAQSAVVSDLSEMAIYVGIPAKPIKKK